MSAAPCLNWSPARPSPNAMRRAWNGCRPRAGCVHSRMIRSGVFSATSSMSMPPAWEAMTTCVERPRSSVIDRYSSRSMAEASSTITLRTLMPSGGVCGVLSIMPRICGELDAAALAAPTRVHLRLHHHLAAQPLRDLACSLRRVGDVALRHAHTGLTQELLGLVLVDLHRLGRLLAGAAKLAQQPHEGIDVVGHALFHR